MIDDLQEARLQRDPFARLGRQLRVVGEVVFCAIDLAVDQPPQFRFQQDVAGTRRPRRGQLPAFTEADHRHRVVQRFDFDTGA